MVRQSILGTLLGLALAWGTGHAAARAQHASPSTANAPARPVPEIPLARLTPDAVLPLALEPGAVASDEAVWTTASADGAVVRVNASDNKVASPFAVGRQPCASLVVAFNSVWVPLCGTRQLARMSLTDGKVSATITMGVASADGRIATSVGSVWVVSDRKGVVSRLDPDINAPVSAIYVAAGATAVVSHEDALWITSEESNRLTRVNAYTNETIETIEVGPKPGRLAVGEGGVWTLNRGDGSVTRVDPATNKVVATILIGPAVAAGEIAAGAGSVWISTPGVPIVRIDPRTNRAVQRFTGEGGGAILVAHGSLWVAVGPKLTWRLDPLLVATVRP